MFNILDTMPLQTSKLFEEFSAEKYMQEWVLVGGTALATRLNHRVSEDLDFFNEDSKLHKGTLSKLEAFISHVSQKHDVILTDSSETVRDYLINGVKVTFFASGIKTGLSSNATKHGNILIASQDTIAAMKIKSILSYRIKSRDFYDIYTLLQNKDYDLGSLLDNFQKYYPSDKFLSAYITKRLIQAPLNVDDEGLEIVSQNKISFDDIRKYIKIEILSLTKSDNTIIQEVINEEIETKALQEKSFGIERHSLIVNMYLNNEMKIFRRLLKNGEFNLTNKGMDGKNLLDICSQDLDTIKEILKYSKDIPETLIDGSHFKDNKEVLDLVIKESTIISSVKHLNNPQRLKTIAKNKNLDLTTFIEDVKSKCDLLTHPHDLHGSVV